ncbi:MAG TPA: radical SAM protein [Candidatus Binatia bacterium]|nr:radical SAM protein [Candidatus Binatia bacterium]
MTNPALLKVLLAANGVRVDPLLRGDPTVDRPLGSSAATRLDLVLPDAVRVSAPIVERSPFLLVGNGRGHLVEGETGGATPLRVAVEVTPLPRFLGRRTRSGMPMSRIAAVRGEHLVLSPAAACGFSVHGAPCRFCVEGARSAVDREAAAVEDVVEVVRAAFEERAGSDVYFNSGVFDAEDGGIGFLTPYVEAVRRHFDTLVAVQVHPPRANAWIDHAYAMGVDALSFNLEIFDETAFERHCVGRARYIGRDRYLEALAYAARIFPSGTVWTDLVLGVEPVASTLAGIDALTALGVVPVVSIVRGDHALPPPDELGPVLAGLYRAVRDRGIALGWVRDLALGVSPLEARWFAGDGARLAVAMQHVTRSRLGGAAARTLARFRRRLRVRGTGDPADVARH